MHSSGDVQQRAESDRREVDPPTELTVHISTLAGPRRRGNGG